MIPTNTFDQLVDAAREALAALDEQDALLVEQLRSMAAEGEQRAEQRRRIEACLDALVPVSVTAAPEPLELEEEPAPAAEAIAPEVHGPPAPRLAIRQVAAEAAPPTGRRFCPGCGGSWGSILHREHMEAVNASDGQLLREDPWATAEEPATTDVAEADPEEAPPAQLEEPAPVEPQTHKHHFMFGNVPDEDGLVHGRCACGQDSSAPVEPENTSTAKNLNRAQRAAKAALEGAYA